MPNGNEVTKVISKAETDAEGKAVLYLENGDYLISFKKKGYNDGSTPVKVNDESPLPIEMTLDKITEFAVELTVKGADGKGIPGVAVDAVQQ